MPGWAWQGVPSVTSQRAALLSCAFWQTFSEKLSQEIEKKWTFLLFWGSLLTGYRHIGKVDFAQCETSDSFQSSCPPATG